MLVAPPQWATDPVTGAALREPVTVGARPPAPHAPRHNRATGAPAGR
eukprot:gene8608-21730_t